MSQVEIQCVVADGLVEEGEADGVAAADVVGLALGDGFVFDSELEAPGTFTMIFGLLSTLTRTLVPEVPWSALRKSAPPSANRARPARIAARIAPIRPQLRR
jgi:hypothetical protein